MASKKITKSSIIGGRGVNLIEKVVLEMGCLWYPTGGVEAGIDGLIEIRDVVTGEVTNSILQVQSKATNGRFTAETATSFEYLAMPLLDRAKNVLLRLELEQLGEKPLVFITHSMGGLLVKQMLRTANDSTDPKRKTIVEQTRGVCFIATPHIGSDLAKWAFYFRILLGTNVSVDELRPHHPQLRDLNQWYRDFVAREQVNIKTVTFYEMKPLPGIGLVVAQGDADPGVPNTGLHPLDDDHRTICKPASKQTDTAGPLIHAVIQHAGMGSYFEQPLFIVATLRNRLSNAHGSGTQQRNIPTHFAKYAINATAAALLLLVEACT